MLSPSGKAHGLYSCPSRILKCSRDIIAKPLTTLINVSVQNGRFPSRLKDAKIVPVFKDGDETDPCNYRPISLLSIFKRIFEEIMSNRLKVFLNKHDISYKSQYDFRKRCSTEHAILDIVSKLQANMDLGMFSCGIFIDLQNHSTRLTTRSCYINSAITM